MAFYSRFDRITRRLYITVGTTEYALCYTLQGLEELEARLGTPIGSVFKELETMNLTSIVDALWIALKGCNNELTREEAVPIIAGYMHEHGFPDMIMVFSALIALSGILGAESANKIFKSLGMGLKDKEEKNVETAKPAIE